MFRASRSAAAGAASDVAARPALDANMQNKTVAKKQKCKNCEGKGTLKKGDKVVRCQRCGGTGIKR
jgi:DnaJ-class molecular chaperone